MDASSHSIWQRPSHLPPAPRMRSKSPRPIHLPTIGQNMERDFDEKSFAAFNIKPKLPLLQDQEDREVLDFFKAVFRQHKSQDPRRHSASDPSGDPNLNVEIPKKNPREPPVALGLGVNKGNVYVKGLPFTQQERSFTYFLPTHELGPPGALNRWLVDVKGFREDEISFSLTDDILEVECRSQRPPSKEELVVEDHTPWDKEGTKGRRKSIKATPRTQRNETIQLPPNSNLAKLRVYENKQLAKLIVALMP